MALTATARGTGGNNTAASSVDITPATTIAAGSIAVVTLSYDNSGSGGSDPYSSISGGPSGGTATLRQSRLYDPGVANAGLVVRTWTITCPNGWANGTNFTVNFSPDVTAKAWAICEIAPASGYGVAYSNGAINTGSASASPTITSASLTTGDCIVGFGGAEYSDTWVGDSDTSNGSWSTAQTAGYGTTTSGQSVIHQCKVVTGTATQTFNPTLTSADQIIGWVSLREFAAYTLTCAAGSLALTGVAATPKVGFNLPCAAGTLALTGADATLTYTPAGYDDYPLTCAAGTLALTGNAATLKRGAVVACASGSLTLTGVAAAPKAGFKLTCDTGSLALTGVAAGLRVGRKLAATTGALTLTGVAVTLTYTPAGAYLLTCSTGALSMTGNATGLRADRRLAAAVGSLTLTGADTALRVALRVAAANGTLSLTGNATTLTYTPLGGTAYSLVCAAGTLALSGGDITLSATFPALYFDGKNDSVAIGDLGLVEDGAFAFEAVLRMPAAAPSINRYLFAEYGATALVGVALLAADAGKLRFVFRDDTGATCDILSPASVCDGGDHYLAVEAGGVTGRLYLDGVLATGPVALPSGTVTTTAATLGSRGAADYWYGGVYSARAYPDPLGAAAVAAQYDAWLEWREYLPNVDLIATLCGSGWRARLTREGWKATTAAEGWRATTRRS